MARDAHRLARRLDQARAMRDHAVRTSSIARLAAEVEAAQARVATRHASVPAIRYPEELPVSQRRDEILAAIRDHQVVIIAGETGSGKTTQLPKLCLELGRGVLGMIGHTQPRRIAARTVAERIAEELGSPIAGGGQEPSGPAGGLVGYQMRFTDRVGPTTLVKLMTDGILLNELAADRLLRQYDTLIIDEAHERSLNIDFILGYLHGLLPRRPDLKVIITSATIDPHRFARHFHDAPVIEVSGRTYPVEMRYRPLTGPDSPGGPANDDRRADQRGDQRRGGDRGGGDRGGDRGSDRGGGDRGGDRDSERDQVSAICTAVDELCAEGPGDILVFLSGEREIRDTADALARQDRPATEVVPLYARLSSAEQHRVFTPHTGRRIVLATNVAETSLTVPGIRYVIDPGLARISRYSHRTKVQRLPIEPVSQASANQRAGRCGRTSDGICIRLYAQEDFDARPAFTDPEILRTNLASVILQMEALGLGEMADFPFLDPPESRQIADGVRLLVELGALVEDAEPGKRLTPTGRSLAQLPVDPRLGRMVLAAGELGCLSEVLVIASALAIQDPRERPVEQRPAADQAHARFTDPTSDFLSILNLWRHLRSAREERSSNQFRRMCRTEFLNYLRIREWQDVHGQLRSIARGLGLEPNESPADVRSVHQALLTGLLSHIGRYEPEKKDYLGARGARFAIFPGSGLARRRAARPETADGTGAAEAGAGTGTGADGEQGGRRGPGIPTWVVAAELVETSRLWARTVARIEPDWVEPLAEHLLRRTYSEPHWSRRQGAALAYEKVTLYGVPLVTARLVQYGRIDPVVSRELFVRHALVEGDWNTRHAFFRTNRELLADVEELEHRARRRDILVDDQTLYEFYDERVPADVVSGRHFDSWWKATRRTEPDLLDFSASMLVNDRAGTVRQQDYPDAWVADGVELPLTYQFTPGDAADGVTVRVPLPALGGLRAEPFTWLVPGLREELITAMIRGLPKVVRRGFVPAPNYARAVLDRITPDERPLADAVAAELHRMSGSALPTGVWSPARLAEVLPPHLRITFRIVDDRGATLGEGKDLAELRNRLRPKTRAVVSAAAAGVERSGLLGWDVGTLPAVIERSRGGHVVRAHPALVDEGGSVAVRVFDDRDEADRAMWAGTRRLLLLNVPSPVRGIIGRLPNAAKLALSNNPHRDISDLLDDCVSAAMDVLLRGAGGPVRDEAGFRALLDTVRAELPETALTVVRATERVLALAHQIDRGLRTLTSPALLATAADLRGQLGELIHRGFVTRTGVERLPDLERYLTAAQRRVERLPGDAARDRQLTTRVGHVLAAFRELTDELGPEGSTAEPVQAVRWMIEELRVSLFAQALRTPYPISEERIYRAIDGLRRS
ncbi:ATP-dependent RNA helicase HrpA [Parafrankia elaeagni]|uniref:ATP-dependent RNA helicase HrpA n=1 Tax=Parafrankia elaeagni TaxID=222534 RepID=UPI0006882AF5|nr:ATP-dependent RNA helicase HrpA [Parafrankia elaeagni]